MANNNEFELGEWVIHRKTNRIGFLVYLSGFNAGVIYLDKLEKKTIDYTLDHDKFRVRYQVLEALTDLDPMESAYYSEQLIDEAIRTGDKDWFNRLARLPKAPKKKEIKKPETKIDPYGGWGLFY